jgi:hypothetical protein
MQGIETKYGEKSIIKNCQSELNSAQMKPPLPENNTKTTNGPHGDRSNPDWVRK